MASCGGGASAEEAPEQESDGHRDGRSDEQVVGHAGLVFPVGVEAHDSSIAQPAPQWQPQGPSGPSPEATGAGSQTVPLSQRLGSLARIVTFDRVATA